MKSIENGSQRENKKRSVNLRAKIERNANFFRLQILVYKKLNDVIGVLCDHGLTFPKGIGIIFEEKATNSNEVFTDSRFVGRIGDVIC